MIYLVSENNQLFYSDDISKASVHFTLQYFKNHESIALDTETTGFDVFNDKLLTVQLGDSENQFVIDCLTVDIRQFKELIESKLILVHNYAFDGKWMHHNNIDFKNVYDSFLAECVLTAGYDAKERLLGLNDVSNKHLGIEISKDDRGLIHRQGLTERVIRYCARDVEFLHKIKEKQEEKIKEFQLEKVLELENKVARPFMLMCYNGVLIDKDKWSEVAKYTESEVDKIGNILDDLIIEESVKNSKLKKYLNNRLSLFPDDFEESKTIVNWRSPEQKKKILNDLGLKVDSVSDKILQRNKNIPIVKSMIDFSKNAKFADTFGSSFLDNINKKTGRIHGEIFQVVSTGRISIANPPLQQIPSHGELASRLKECFIAREGYTLVDTDVSGFEIAIATEFSQEPKWINTLSNNGDIHSETAMLMFGITREQVNDPFPERPNYTYRFIAKSLNFLALYGGDEHTLAERILIPKQRAKELLNMYFASLPILKKFFNMLSEVAVENGRIRCNSYYKRLRFFPKLYKEYSDDKEYNRAVAEVRREAMNCPMQGTNADLIKQCIVNLQNEMDMYYLDVKLLLQIHDALLDECNDLILSEWIERKEKIMIDTISTYIKSVPIKVSTTHGKHWLH